MPRGLYNKVFQPATINVVVGLVLPGRIGETSGPGQDGKCRILVLAETQMPYKWDSTNKPQFNPLGLIGYAEWDTLS